MMGERVGLGLGVGGWGGDMDMMIMKRYLLMIVGCVIYIDICYQGVGGGRVWLKLIDRSLLAL